MLTLSELTQKKNYFVSLLEKEVATGRTPETYRLAEIAADLEDRLARIHADKGDIDSAVVNRISQSAIYSMVGDYGKSIQILRSLRVYASEKVNQYIDSEIIRLSAKIT